MKVFIGEELSPQECHES